MRWHHDDLEPAAKPYPLSRWAWLAVPIASVALAGVHLLAAITRTRCDDVLDADYGKHFYKVDPRPIICNRFAGHRGAHRCSNWAPFEGRTPPHPGAGKGWNRGTVSWTDDRNLPIARVVMP